MVEGTLHAKTKQRKRNNPEDQEDGVVDQGDERRETEEEMDEVGYDKVKEGKD